MWRTASITALSVLVLCPIVSSEPPKLITHQGRLTDSNGSTIIGAVELAFGIHDAAIGGNELWTETHNIITDPGGRFNVRLGSSTPLNLAFDEPYWLSMTVNGEAMSSRLELTTSPYTFNALGVEDGVVTGSTIADGAVVRSLNTLTEDVVLQQGQNITITPSGNTLTISSSGTSPWEVLSPVSIWFNGRVGIGTFPDEELHVIGEVLATSLVDLTDTVFRVDPDQTSRLEHIDINSFRMYDPIVGNTDGLVLTSDDNGNGTWQPGSPWAVAGTDISFGVGGGSVGIGTTTPAAKLHVVGNVDVGGIRTDAFTLSTASVAGDVLTSDGAGGASWQPASGGSGNWTEAGNDLYPSNPQANVGIGTTAPQEKLHVSGNMRASRLVDDDATGFYVDPNSLSRLGLLEANQFTDRHDTGFFVDPGGESGVSAKLNGPVGIGIGIAFPQQQLEVGGAVQAHALVDRDDTGFFLDPHGDSSLNTVTMALFRDADDPLYFVDPVGAGTVSATLAQKVGIGTFQPQQMLDVNGTTRTNVLEIVGGADLAEPFEMSSGQGALPEGSVVVIDKENPGKLRLSTDPYDRKVAGIISGAGGLDPGLTLSQQGVVEAGQHVALTGRVYCWADASTSPIEPGDLLTTSEVPGHAMKATDHNRAKGAIVGKAMTPLRSGTGLVLVLVNLL